MSRPRALQITAGKPGAALTPAQKRFNNLLKQIEQARETLAAWNENTAAALQARAEVLQPLQAQLVAGQRQWAFALDQLLGQRKWTKAESGTLRALICSAAGELLDTQGEDPELKALFDKHADVDFDTEQRESVLAMKGLAEAITGLDLGDDEIDSEADLFLRMEKGMQARAAAEEAARASKAERRRKTAAQQRREAEEQQATLTVREIYRKLASALHPDRETDAAQRAEKTDLMQRVNQAYAANDLLTLLQLQLQVEQIDASHVANASAARLRHYNKVLAEQLAELKAEVGRVEMAFRMDFGLEPGFGLNPRKLGQLLEQTIREWRADLEQQRQELRMLDDTAAVKRWLKCERERQREEDFDFF